MLVVSMPPKKAQKSSSSKSNTPNIAPLGGTSAKKQNTTSKLARMSTLRSSAHVSSGGGTPTPSMDVGKKNGPRIDFFLFGIFVLVLGLAFIGQTTNWYEFDLTLLWQFWPLWIIFLSLAFFFNRLSWLTANTFLSLLFVGTIGVIWIGGLTPSDFNIAIAETVRGKGELLVEKREVANFDRIQLNGRGTAIITQGSAQEVVVQAEDTVMQNVITSVTSDKVLTIDFKKERLWERVVPKQAPTFYITVDDIERIDVSGSGKVVSSTLNASALELQLHGSGSFDINMFVNKLVVHALGSGVLTLSGNANAQEVVIDGSAAYDAQNLLSKDISVELSGSGAAALNVLRSLDVRMDGSGNITYFGTPEVSQEVSGSGTLERYAPEVSLISN